MNLTILFIYILFKKEKVYFVIRVDFIEFFNFLFLISAINFLQSLFINQQILSYFNFSNVNSNSLSWKHTTKYTLTSKNIFSLFIINDYLFEYLRW